MRGKRLKTLLLTGAVLLTATGFMGCDDSTAETPDTKVEDKKTDETKETSKEEKTFTLKFGQLLDSTITDDVLVIKAKIEPSYSNKATISQNGFNIEDLILKQDAGNYKEIQYWAVSDMKDGSESKVISFTVDKSLIDSIKNKNVVGNQIVDNAKDVWVLQSLMQ